MTMPVRSLPVAQNWDCGGCSACCRQYRVSVSAEERKRIEGQGWEADPDLAGVPYFVREGTRRRPGGYRLNHRADGACVFLGADNRCKIHARHGSAAKPFACRVYPFSLVPAGDHWRLGLRFACPSAAADVGRPLADYLPEVREYAATLEAEQPGTADAPPTPLQPGQTVPWADVLRFTAAASGMLADDGSPVELRLRRVLALAAMCRKATFDKVTGPRR